MIFLGGEVSVGSESRVTHFFNMGKMEDLLSFRVLQGSSFLSNEINTKRGKVSLIFSTRVKSKTCFLPPFNRGRPYSLMK